MRRLASVLVLLVVMVVGDRVAAAYAGDRLAEELRRGAGLTSTPTVEIAGFPFLTQAVGGRYDHVEVGATDVPAGDTVLDRVDVVLTGVRVGLSEALSGEVTDVPVDRVSAQVRLSYDDLSRRSGERRLTVSPEGDRVRVTGEVEVLGRTLSAAALSEVALDGDTVRITAQEFRVGNDVADALLTRALGDRFDLRVPITDLPYALTVQRLRVAPDAVVVEAGATDTVLTP